jgi:hypothetical protein
MLRLRKVVPDGDVVAVVSWHCCDVKLLSLDGLTIVDLEVDQAWTRTTTRTPSVCSIVIQRRIVNPVLRDWSIFDFSGSAKVLRLDQRTLFIPAVNGEEVERFGI